jgi:cupredoxin-like protein
VSGRPSAAAFLAALALGVCLPGCREGGSTTAVSTIPAISILPDDPSQPYGITAIDYHFHDAHPTFPLAPSRTVTWTNDGTVVHNVTLPQLGYSKDVPLGATIRIRDLGRKLGGPGTYTFFCAYHENLGMIGTIIIR